MHCNFLIRTDTDRHTEKDIYWTHTIWQFLTGTFQFLTFCEMIKYIFVGFYWNFRIIKNIVHFIFINGDFIRKIVRRLRKNQRIIIMYKITLQHNMHKTIYHYSLRVYEVYLSKINFK